MTDKEAIETIKLAVAEVEWDYPMDYAIAFEKAIKALEKQIPKKPAKERFLDGYICPNCRKPLRTYIDVENCRLVGYERISLNQAHCEECGQAIYRGEEE